MSTGALSSKNLPDVLTLAGTPVTKYYTETVTLAIPGAPQPQPPIKEPIDATIEIARQIKVKDQLLGTFTSRLLIRNAPGFNGKIIGGLKPGVTVNAATLGADSDDVLRYQGVIQNMISEIPPEIPEKSKNQFKNANVPGGWFAIDLDQLTEADVRLQSTGQGGETTLEGLQQAGFNHQSGLRIGWIGVFGSFKPTSTKFSSPAGTPQKKKFKFEKLVV